jgi:hypothetical protein
LSARALAWPSHEVGQQRARGDQRRCGVETLVVGAKAGLVTQVMLAVINLPSGRNSVTLDNALQSPCVRFDQVVSGAKLVRYPRQSESSGATKASNARTRGSRSSSFWQFIDVRIGCDRNRSAGL